MRAIVTIVLLVATVAGTAGAQSVDPYLVVPGKSIGPLSVGMPITDAAKLLGTPKPAITKLTSLVLPLPEGALAFRWEPSTEAQRQGATRQGFDVITDKTGMVYEVHGPFDNRYRTVEGLGVGSKPTDVVAAFGPSFRQLTAGYVRFFVYDQRGIAWLIQEDRRVGNVGLVNGIWVFAPRAAP